MLALVPRGREVWAEEGGGGFFRLARKDSLGSRIAFSWDSFLLSSLPLAPLCALVPGCVPVTSDELTVAGNRGVPASDKLTVAGTRGVPTSDELPVAGGTTGVPASDELTVAGNRGVPTSDELTVAGTRGVPDTVLLPWGAQDDATNSTEPARLGTTGKGTETATVAGVGPIVRGWVFLWSLNEG